jgi:alkylhydroperoxidase family enzyme
MNQAKSPARIEPVPPETSPDLKRVFEAIQSIHGFLPNAFLIMRRKPKMVRAIQQMAASVWGSDNKVDLGLKHLIAHVASRSAGCRYCMAHTADIALRVDLDEKKLVAVWEYQTSPLFNGAERSALDLAVAGAAVPNAVTESFRLLFRTLTANS